MMEVNHRAKNSLAVAGTLLGLQARRQSDPDVRMLLGESQERLSAMARVHDLLSKSESHQHVDVAIYLAQLSEALGGITDVDRIRLRTYAEAGLLLDADTAFPLGIILTELITNALKYAFPDSKTGMVTSKARRLGSGLVELVVQDDGVGMVEPREGSLGCGLARSLVKQIRGEIALAGEAARA